MFIFIFTFYQSENSLDNPVTNSLTTIFYRYFSHCRKKKICTYNVEISHVAAECRNVQIECNEQKKIALCAKIRANYLQLLNYELALCEIFTILCTLHAFLVQKKGTNSTQYEFMCN